MLSKKQFFVSRSNAEFEYKVMPQSICEIVWIYHLLTKMGLKQHTLKKIQFDNQDCVNITLNSVYHAINKNIEGNCHFIDDKIHEIKISTRNLMTEQLADFSTKVVS